MRWLHLLPIRQYRTLERQSGLERVANHGLDGERERAERREIVMEGLDLPRDANPSSVLQQGKDLFGHGLLEHAHGHGKRAACERSMLLSEILQDETSVTFGQWANGI